ncbi:MAG: MBL fold metallo-hydrolase [Dehalococcoidia bacterium]|jgi:glyoxylase-like metal-dependent hydrolase (beta-lactamase superfamily II)|nr:MBL fold metallo-hydrolase [Dehalococcoidia bacterium]
MSRDNGFRRSDEPNPQPQPSTGEPATSEPQVAQPVGSVITLHLGGRNPLKSFNTYVIRGQRHILVDPGPPDMAGELLEQLSRNRISLGDIGLIVLTHGHPDHFGSAARLKEWTQAPVAVHELDAEYVHWGTVPPLKPVTRLGMLCRFAFNAKSEPVEPDIILREGDRLNRYAGRGRVILTPGHTAGSISILLPDGQCIVGDLMMRGLRARTPSLSWYAEAPSELRQSLQKVVSAGARTLLASRGGPFDVTALSRKFSWLEVPVNTGSVEAEDRPQPRVAEAGTERVVSPSASELGVAPAARPDDGDPNRPRRHRSRHRRPGRREGSPEGGPPPADSAG